MQVTVGMHSEVDKGLLGLTDFWYHGKGKSSGKIYGPLYENCYLRINMYREFDNKFESPDNVLAIKARRLE